LGIRGNVTRTNLAYANEHRDWRVYEAFAQVLIRNDRRLYRKDFNGLDIDEMVYAVDSFIINLCLSMFPWLIAAGLKPRLNSTLKLTWLVRSLLFMQIIKGSVHYVNFMDQMLFQPYSSSKLFIND
jgi:hypothetical protein